MNSPNEESKPSDNMELLKQQAEQTQGCGPDCGCHAPAAGGKMRWMVGILILIAAGVLIVRAVTKNNGASPEKSSQGFSSFLASQAAPNETADTPTASSAGESIGISIAALSELGDSAAAKFDAVFVFLPGKDGIRGRSPVTALNNAKRAIESKTGFKVGFFTLKADSRDYDQMGKEVTVPGVVAMVKGRGMSAISGDITEAKLVQGFVSASSSCGPSAAPGCCPK